MKTKFIKFLMKVAIFATSLFLICIVVYVAFSKFPMYFFDDEYVLYQYQKDYIYNNDDYNRVIISGDSKPQCAFLPALLSDDTYNIASIGVTPLENYYYLKEYLENHPIPETIFISFTPYHYMEFNTFWTRSVYFHRLSKAELEDVYETALRFDDTEEILTNFDKEVSKYKYYSVKKYGKAFIKSFFEDRYKENSEMYYNMGETRGQVYFGKADYSNDLNPEANYTDFKPLDIMDYYFRKTIDMCLDYEINLIIEVVPMNKSTYEACTKNYLCNFSNYMKGIQEEYPQITVNTDLYYYSNDYFGDAAHFNPKGTEKYSKYIKEKYPEVFETPR